jgi:hypothetical protein
MILTKLVQSIECYEEGIYNKIKKIVNEPIYFIANVDYDAVYEGDEYIHIAYCYDYSELKRVANSVKDYFYNYMVYGVDGVSKNVNVYSNQEYIPGIIVKGIDMWTIIDDVKIFPIEDISYTELKNKTKDRYTLLTNYNEIRAELKKDSIITKHNIF